jgi:hypothetical protein
MMANSSELYNIFHGYCLLVEKIYKTNFYEDGYDPLTRLARVIYLLDFFLVFNQPAINLNSAPTGD